MKETSIENIFLQKILLLELAERQLIGFSDASGEIGRRRIVSEMKDCNYSGPFLKILESNKSLDPDYNREKSSYPIYDLFVEPGYPRYGVEKKILDKILNITEDKSKLIPLIRRTLWKYENMGENTPGYYAPWKIAFHMVYLIGEIGDKTALNDVLKYYKRANHFVEKDSKSRLAFDIVKKLAPGNYEDLLSSAKGMSKKEWKRTCALEYCEMGESEIESIKIEIFLTDLLLIGKDTARIAEGKLMSAARSFSEALEWVPGLHRAIDGMAILEDLNIEIKLRTRLRDGSLGLKTRGIGDASWGPTKNKRW